MLQDFRFAVRTFRRHLRANALAVFMLSLALGACATIFSLIGAILLRPLPFDAPEQLVRIYSSQDRAGSHKLRVSEGSFFDWRRENRAFANLVAAQNTGMSITDSERALNPLMRRVSDGYFETFGVEPALGRMFAREEFHPGTRVVILDHGFWQSYFGGDPEILGQTIELAYESYEVIGVMPSDYVHPSFASPPTLWLPMPEPDAPERSRGRLLVFGRLADGVSLAQAREDLDAIQVDLAARYPETDAGRNARVLSLHDSLAEDVKPALWALFGAVVFVLLMAWTNVANLLLAGAVGRQQEIGIRRALGARRQHLIRQLMIECLLLGAVAAALGLLIAFWTVGPLQTMAPSNTNVPLLDQVRVDERVVAFTIAIALGTSLLFGFAPMLHLLGQHQAPDSLRTTASAGRRRLRSALVVFEVAMSLVLLIGAGLMVRTYVGLQSLDLGFEPKNLLVLRTGARGPGFEDADGYRRFFDRTLENLATVPGVEAVGSCEILPMFSTFRPADPIRPAEALENEGEALQAVPLRVSSEYFQTVRQAILDGRAPTVDDTADSEPVAVISKNLANKLWPAGRAVGQRVAFGTDEEIFRVVGVAEDLRGLVQAPEPPQILYLPFDQAPASTMSIFLRTSVDPKAIFEASDQEIWTISRDVPIFAHSTLDQIVRDIEWQPRFTMQLLLTFATLALLMALSGLFAVLSYEIMERRRELGVRVAVGASREQIFRLVLGNAARLTTLGRTLGLAGSLALSKVLESQLYGLSAIDPLTYSVLIAALAISALVAAWIPANKATRLDPVEALRDP